jgi:hypothetical protein
MTQALSMAWLKRAFKKIEVIESGCWQWTGKVTGGGYAEVKINRKHTLLHRAFYVTYKGPITGNLFACHTCDNPRCVNPDHLFLGTHEDNMRDMREKGRARGASNQGKGQEQTRLTPEQVIEIYQSTKQNVVLSVEYDVNTKTIYEIKSGKTWVKLTAGLKKGAPEFKVPNGFKLVPLDQPAATVPQVVQAPLDELLARYWDLAYVEGREGRNVDAPNNDAQRVLSSIKQLFRAAPQPVAAPIVPSDEQQAEILRLAQMADAAIRQGPGDMRNIMEDIANGLTALLTTASNAGVAAQGDK